MDDLTPTFAYEDDNVYAVVEGRVVASGDSIEAIEDETAEYVDALSKEREAQAYEKSKKSATHVITPNGIKGHLVARTPDIWGEQVTVRLENGQIDSFHVTAGSKPKYLTEQEDAPANPIERLASTLEASYEKDKDALAKRIEDLKTVSKEASELIIRGASYADERRLHELRLAADAEAKEAQSALDYLLANDLQIEPLAPFEAQVVEQASLGRGAKDDWLEVSAREMVAESEGENFKKIIDEGPGLLAAELDTGTLAHAGSTREAAQEFITSKTAGFTGDDVNEYRELFVARTEVARRKELAARKQSQKKQAQRKQAQRKKQPLDEALFM